MPPQPPTELFVPLRVALAQCNPIVGDIDGNAAMILSMWH
ncbi:MAG: putative amidohydrolase, partial [Myxococcota bacterium]